jgi:hypothetical protein
MGNRCCQGGDGGDADVCACAGRWARGREHYHRQAQVAEYEADEAARDCGCKAPERDGDEEERMQALEYLRWLSACAA